VRFVSGRDAYKIAFKNEPPVQKEGAPMSTTVLYSRLRTAGAAAREVLVRAAAARWKAAITQCRTEKDVVIGPNGERLSYGALAGDAAKLPLNAAPPLKDRAQFTLISKPLSRLDTRAKSTGSATFGIDVVVPDMRHGAIRSAPTFIGSLTAVRNEAEILKMPGVRAVVRLPAVHVANEEAGSQHPGLAQGTRHNPVCVVAERFWQAKRAADALGLAFDPGAGGDLSTAGIDGLSHKAPDAEKGVTAVEVGRPLGGVSGPEAMAVQRAWIARDVPQCGYCQSGQIVSAIALLKAIRKPTDHDIDLAMAGNLSLPVRHLCPHPRGDP
jgi:isoquinoline 1-oxidoreductase beta subunit